MVTQTAKSRSDERRQAILGIAGEMFLQEGYAAVSMSAIAARLGGSKGTLYNYFTSKTELFAAYMTEACAGNSEAIFGTMDDETPLREALRRIGTGFLTLVLDDASMALQRLIIAEAQRFPEVGQAFYAAGPKLGAERLGAWMKGRMERGELREADPELAARQFLSLCKAGPYSLRLWNVTPAIFSPDEIAAHVHAQVDMFLAAYGRGAQG